MASLLVLGAPGHAAGPDRFAARPAPERDRHLDQPPLGSHVIDFDDAVGTCSFGETTALRLDYISLGVSFTGNGPLDGGAIVHECIGENVTGQSSPNYLAFSWNGALADGGVPLLPETLTFNPPVSHVQLNAASPGSASMVISAYDYNNFWVGEDAASIGPTMTTLAVSAPGITKLIIQSDAAFVAVDDLAFLGPQYDSDGDGLSDLAEISLGTDPGNPDTDGDLLPDGYEYQHQLDPLDPADSQADGDGDGLNNLRESAFLTDPWNPDTDADGLEDGAEVDVFGSAPLDPDTDDDGLTDGDEVHTHQTDPTLPDSDGGGVPDGIEVQEGTDPLDSSDDAADVALVVEGGTQTATLVQARLHALGGNLWLPAAPTDCVVSPDGATAFVSANVPGILLVQMSNPPTLLPTPIVVSAPASDLAFSPDGRFVLACGGSNLSVIDARQGVERRTFPISGGCDAVDVCPDGTVLVTVRSLRMLRRLHLDARGLVTNPGLGEITYLTSPPINVNCVGSTAAVVVQDNGHVTSYRLPDLQWTGDRTLSHSPGIAAAIAPNGRRVFIETRGGLDAFEFDPVTAQLGATPLYTRNVSTWYGSDALGIAASGEEIFVPQVGSMAIFRAEDGASVATLPGSFFTTPSICFRTLYDSDWDGLPDQVEHDYGTDPRDPDSDDDGLQDGFEVQEGFDPLAGADGAQDPDGDGLDNVGEQSAYSDPQDPDSDDDGLSDGEEVLSLGSDPNDSDTDDDGRLDGEDNCPSRSNWDQRDEVHPNDVGDVCDDPDQDGAMDAWDNCPDVGNPQQEDGEGDGRGDACDPYPERRLIVRAEVSAWGITGLPLRIRYVLEDGQSGHPVTDLVGIRTTLTLTGSATFGQSATDGVLVSGGGTNRALVEFVDGVVTLTILDTVAESITPSNADSEGNGVGILKDVFETFDETDGGFVHAGWNDPWVRGRPTSGPGAGFGGLWATGLAGSYPFYASGSLLSPVFRLSSGTHPLLWFGSWFEAGFGDHGTIFLQVDEQEYTLATLNGIRGWDYREFPLFAYVGSNVRLRLAFESDGISESLTGWRIESFGLYGLSRHIEFLDAGEDEDGDGLSNEREVTLGTNPHDWDSDDDLAMDGEDNCPLLSNPNQADHVHPDNGSGDACDDPDRDGIFDTVDNCPDAENVEQMDDDGDGHGNACDLCPQTQSGMACVEMTAGEGPCLNVTVGLLSRNVTGRVEIVQERAVVPVSLRFELLEGFNCEPGDTTFDFLLNGQVLGSIPGGTECGCIVRTFIVDDRQRISSLWSQGGNNTFGVIKAGGASFLGWVRVIVNREVSQQQHCVFDVFGGDCTDYGACYYGPSLPPFDAAREFEDHLDTVPVVERAFSGSELPERMDLRTLSDGDYALCVRATPQSGGTLVAMTSGGTIATLDAFSGEAHVLGSLPFAGDEVEYEPLTGRAFLQGGWPGEGFELSLSTAELGPAIPSGILFEGLEWVEGQLLGTRTFPGTNSSELRRLEPWTGASTPVGPTGWGRITGLAYDPEARKLYGINRQSGTLLQVDPLTGQGTPLGSTNFQVGSLEFGPDGKLYGGTVGTFRGRLLEFDPKSGEVRRQRLTGLNSDIEGLMLVREPIVDCVPFTRSAQRVLTINGAACDSPPTAAIRPLQAAVECSSPVGALLSLDGSSSSDPDGDLERYDWFERFGEPEQALLGSGPVLDATLPLGPHAITLRVTDGMGASSTQSVTTEVVDTTPPTLVIAPEPALLWPPNHRMVEVDAHVSAQDLCGPASVLLRSITSNEPDDVPGRGDGQTVGDIQGAAVGTPDVNIVLRAERSGTGSGRNYTLSYGAVDASGNMAGQEVTITVPHHLSGATDPLKLMLSASPTGTTVQWRAVPGAERYSLIRGDLEHVHLEGNVIRLGAVTCLAGGTTQNSVPDPSAPLPGRGFVYLVEYEQDGWRSSYGAESAGRERVVTVQDGACP